MTADLAADAIVLLESFPNAIAAHMAKGRLDAEEIPCFLSNENRPYGPISGGVRLHVRLQDLAAARETLRFELVPMQVAPEPDATQQLVACPRCGSQDVAEAPVNQKGSAPMRLFFWLRSSLSGTSHHCFHCGNEF